MTQPNDPALCSRRPYSHEKCDRPVRLHMPESLFMAIMQAAYEDDRSVSEFIRHRLAQMPEIRAHLQNTPCRGVPEGTPR